MKINKYSSSIVIIFCLHLYSCNICSLRMEMRKNTYLLSVCVYVCDILPCLNSQWEGGIIRQKYSGFPVNVRVIFLETLCFEI